MRVQASESHQKILELAELFKSDGPLLIQAYQNESYRTIGTYGTNVAKQMPAVLDERGILKPDVFHNYMTDLAAKVTYAANQRQLLARADTEETWSLLISTLQQMYASVDFKDHEFENSRRKLGDLFEAGKKIGELLGEYLELTGQRKSASWIRHGS